jgi:LacI family transcriptional regulator, repressor for deo operon, udp, cdd, tsx, nupC, and nupG
MADVARAAGVSIGTVSRALRDAPGVSEPNRSRIKQLAEDLSYVVSPEASRLSRGSTGRVLVVAPTLHRWFYATMLAGIERVLREAALDVLIYHVEDAADRHAFFAKLPARRKVDAVVAIAFPVTDDDVRRLELMGVAVVGAGGRLGDHPHVGIDDEAAAGQAVSHLIGLGHRRIAMIRTEDPEGYIWPADAARTRGYRRALSAAGVRVPTDMTVTVPWGVEGGARAIEQLLRRPDPPTAVFAHSDEVAMGALHTLRRAAIAVPERMSVVGVDNHPLAETADLTTVHQPVEEQGRAAGRLVLALLEGDTPANPHVTLPTSLIVRASTAPPRSSTGTVRLPSRADVVEASVAT